MSKLSIVVPVYHNAATLPALLQRFQRISDDARADEFEFIFVDDGSGDDSFAVLEALGAKDDRVRLIRLSRNFGSNPAILAGMMYARGDAVAVISADLQDPPELIAELIRHWRSGYPVVLAARAKRADPLMTRLFANIFNRLFRRFVFRDFPRDGFDFMLLDRRVVDVLVAMREKNSYVFGQVLWSGFHHKVVYYDREERQSGRSRWTTAKKIKYFIDSFTAFSYLPMRIASVLGIILALTGFLYAMFILGLRLFGEVPVTGWASLSILVLITSGVQLVMLGILGEYLWRSLDESRKRPPFVVASLKNIVPMETCAVSSSPSSDAR